MAAQMAVSSIRHRVIVLFNAWFPNDAVYIKDSEHCNECMLNDLCILGVV